MNKQRRIAIAYDRSEESDQALLWCIKKFATRDDLLVLIHIIKLSEVDDEVQDASANASDACMPWKDLHRGHEAAGRSPNRSQLRGTPWRRFEAAIRMCEQHEVSFTAVLARGDVGPTLVETINAQDCDVAVIGARNLNTLQRALLPQTTKFVLQRIDCPLIVHRIPSHSNRSEREVAASNCESSAGVQQAPSRLSEEKVFIAESGKGVDNLEDSNRNSTDSARGRRDSARRIAVAVDGSTSSKVALMWAVKHCYRQGDVILLFHCQPLQFNPGAGYGAEKTFQALEDKAKSTGTSVLKRFAKRLEQKKVSCIQILARGDPASELALLTEKNKCHLLVMGSHGTSYDERKDSGGQWQRLASWFYRPADKTAPNKHAVGSVCFAAASSMPAPLVIVDRVKSSESYK
mmetsp:Transcript_8395/g.28184  ORF Transcript_8395/g.28184 Transcript_8395/m.28184 type:complete len:405 (-) Transcript_8395:271-1485(-)